MTVHQLACLTPTRAVAWKCLSLPEGESTDEQRFAPAAYASRSASLFPGFEGQPAPGVLWVVSAPVYRQRGSAQAAFPPTLTARLEIDRVLTGDKIRPLGNALESDLEIPGDPDRFQRWRSAASITDQTDRAVFRITRSFALLAWRSLRDAGRPREEAWARVRTAVANRQASRFFAHVDASQCLRQALETPAESQVGTFLQLPRRVRSAAVIAELEELARIGAERSVFINYRWNPAHTPRVVDLARELLARRFAVWLDGLTIPQFVDNPVCWIEGKRRRRDPLRNELGALLTRGIDDSALFLCLADGNYLDPPQDKSKGAENWALREYRHARLRALRTGRPRIQVVDLGDAPDVIKRENPGPTLTFDPGVKALANAIAALVRPA